MLSLRRLSVLLYNRNIDDKEAAHASDSLLRDQCALNGPATDCKAYSGERRGPVRPDAVTYDTASWTTHLTPIDRRHQVIQESSRAGSAGCHRHLSDPGRIWLCLHPWLRQQLREAIRAPPSTSNGSPSPACGGETTVVAFSWPSMGKLITALPRMRLTAGPDRWQASQAFRLHFFANLEPVTAAPRQGQIGVPAAQQGNWAHARRHRELVATQRRCLAVDR